MLDNSLWGTLPNADGIQNNPVAILYQQANIFTQIYFPNKLKGTVEIVYTGLHHKLKAELSIVALKFKHKVPIVAVEVEDVEDSYIHGVYPVKVTNIIELHKMRESSPNAEHSTLCNNKDEFDTTLGNILSSPNTTGILKLLLVESKEVSLSRFNTHELYNQLTHTIEAIKHLLENDDPPQEELSHLLLINCYFYDELTRIRDTLLQRFGLEREL